MDTKAERIDTGFLSWEGEKIYLGDELEANDGSKGIVKLDSIKGFYWEREDANVESGSVTLKMAQELSSKSGCVTLFHKVQPDKEEPCLLSIIESDTLKRKFSALYLSEESHKHRYNYEEPRYVDILCWLMDHQVFVVVEPTIITNYRNHEYDCFTRFKYTVYTLNTVYSRRDEDGFDSWDGAADFGIDVAMDDLSKVMIKDVFKDNKQ